MEKLLISISTTVDINIVLSANVISDKPLFAFQCAMRPSIAT